MFYAALELGAVGGILAVANFAVETAVAVERAFAVGDKAAAGAAQERLTPLHREVVGKLGPAGVKAAMDAIGLVGGPPRPPLGEIRDADRDEIAKHLEQARLTAA